MKFYKNFSAGLSTFIFSGVYKISINVALINRGMVLKNYTTIPGSFYTHQNVQYSVNTEIVAYFSISRDSSER